MSDRFMIEAIQALKDNRAITEYSHDDLLKMENVSNFNKDNIVNEIELFFRAVMKWTVALTVQIFILWGLRALLYAITMPYELGYGVNYRYVYWIKRRDEKGRKYWDQLGFYTRDEKGEIIKDIPPTTLLTRDEWIACVVAGFAGGATNPLIKYFLTKNSEI